MNKFFIIFLGLIACQEVTNQDHAIEEISHEITYEILNDQVIINKQNPGVSSFRLFNDSTFYASADFKTYKKVWLYSLDGDLKHEINLEPVCKAARGSLLAYEIINLDTILVLPNYSNIIYLINAEGDIWKTVDLGPHLSTEGFFQLRPCGTPFRFNDTSLVFTLEYLMDNIAPDKRMDFTHYFIESKKAPLLLRVDNIFADSLTTRLGGRGLLNHFSQPSDATNEFQRFKFFDNAIILNSVFSDSIYQLDPNTFEIIKSTLIKSEFCIPKIKPLTAHEYQYGNIDKFIYRKIRARIFNVEYDSDHKRYFVFLKHKAVGETQTASIVILDSNLTQIDEVRIDEKRYPVAGSYIKELGLYLYCEPALKDKNEKHQIVFERFDYPKIN